MLINTAQKNAIEYIKGPCLILAGAGSGKTKVIINKIIHLIKNYGYKPHNIVAVTFTNKAAYEIKMRLLQHLNAIQVKKMIISTFHSLGLEIIKKEINSLSLDSNFSLCDDKDQIILLNKIITPEFELSKTFFKNIIFMISNWKNKFLTPFQADQLAVSVLEKKIALIYKKYDIYLRTFNMLDFDDLICVPVVLLRKNKTVQIRWQKKIAYLLIDEYQDTNNSQYELVKMLTHNHSDFTLVGDDDQSIYSWRGAKPQNILLLKNDYSNLKIIKMEHNYRSSGRILKVANSLILNNIHYFQKKLFSKLDYGSKINVMISANEEQQAEKIAKKIFYQKSIEKIEYKDCAVLYRTNHQSNILEKIFIKQNIPYSIASNTSFFARPEIKDLLAYLRVVINPNDNHAFTRILNVPSRTIGSNTLKKLEDLSHKEKKSLFQISKNIKKNHLLTDNTIKKIKGFIDWIEIMIEKSHLEPIKILYVIIKDIKYESWLSKTLKEKNKIKQSIHNIYTLCQWFKTMLQGNILEKPMTLSQIVNKITLHDIEDNHSNKNTKNQVQLMTLHASKGLEFSSVFIIGMIEGILPNRKSIDANNIEEERRLTYVGITRAKQKLYFSFCRQHYEYGKILYAEPSRFLFELPSEDLHIEKNMTLTKYVQNVHSKSRIQELKNILQNIHESNVKK